MQLDLAQITSGVPIVFPKFDPLILGICWILFGLFGWFLVWLAPTAEGKRTIHRRFMIVIGVVFTGILCCVVWAGFPAAILLLAIPMVIFITWINIRFTTFCDNCRRMIYNRMWWRQIRCCPRCGMELRKPV